MISVVLIQSNKLIKDGKRADKTLIKIKTEKFLSIIQVIFIDNKSCSLHNEDLPDRHCLHDPEGDIGYIYIFNPFAAGG